MQQNEGSKIGGSLCELRHEVAEALPPRQVSPVGGVPDGDAQDVVREPQHVEAAFWTVVGVSVNVTAADCRLGTLASPGSLACVAELRVSHEMDGFAAFRTPEFSALRYW